MKRKHDNSLNEESGVKMANYISDSRLIPRIRQVFINSGKSNFSNLAAKGPRLGRIVRLQNLNFLMFNQILIIFFSRWSVTVGGDYETIKKWAIF